LLSDNPERYPVARKLRNGFQVNQRNRQYRRVRNNLLRPAIRERKRCPQNFMSL
jgi:hypothetical protein